MLPLHHPTICIDVLDMYLINIGEQLYLHPEEGNEAADEESKKAAEGHTPLGKANLNSSTLIMEG